MNLVSVPDNGYSRYINPTGLQRSETLIQSSSIGFCQQKAGQF